MEVKKKEFELRNDYNLDKEKAARLTAVERQLQEDYFAMATFNPQKLEAQDVLYTIGKMNYHTEFEFLDVTDKVITYAFEWSGKHMAENHEVITDIEEYFESISPGNAFYE